MAFRSVSPRVGQQRGAQPSGAQSSGAQSSTAQGAAAPPQGGLAQGAAGTAAAAAAQTPAAASPSAPAAPQQSTSGVPPQSGANAPMAAGSGGGQPSWAQQVHRLAGPEGEQPVAPWKPVREDPFQAAARSQANARPAGLGKRLAARLVDTLVLAAVTGAAAVPLGTRALDHVDEKIDAAKLSGETVTVWLLDGTTAVYLGIVLAVLLVFGVLYEALPTAKWGRTLGKKLCGLQVRDIEGGEPPSFGAGPAPLARVQRSRPSRHRCRGGRCGACSTGRGASAGTTRRPTRSSRADRYGRTAARHWRHTGGLGRPTRRMRRRGFAVHSGHEQ